MAPASLHRIAFAGEDHPMFVKIGSMFVVAAPFPLAQGIALDTYVAALQAMHSTAIAMALSGIATVALLGMWYAFPFLLRTARGSSCS
jgi:hypothetical protein